MVPTIENLKKRYSELSEKIDGSIGSINADDKILNIELELNLSLPADLKLISAFFQGDGLGGIAHYEITNRDPGPHIVGETLRLREAIGLTHNFIVLAELSESIIYLDVGENDFPKVIWCDASDAERASNRVFLSEPTYWNTYADFFEYLLDEEEEERRYDSEG